MNMLSDHIDSFCEVVTTSSKDSKYDQSDVADLMDLLLSQKDDLKIRSSQIKTEYHKVSSIPTGHFFFTNRLVFSGHFRYNFSKFHYYFLFKVYLICATLAI